MTSIAPFPITVCGIEELGGHCATGVSHVLSILDPGHPEPEAFGSYGEHARLELRFHDIIEPEAERLAPGPEHAAAILEFGRGLTAEQGARLLVHCHVGISRSTAAMALILAQARPEASAEAVLQGILAIREKTWPNLRLLELGDAMLGRGGTLPRAAAAIYRHQLGIRPHLVEVMRKAGRGREVDAAEA
ncbi:protein-tyrosine-phosphatase [Belnapia sp. T6]|uniref:Protein-tyrosine-phosphatase n=1 Tax=Belnapia mucosa TaxID=2804532 RepID=A0ABS1V4L5_9PROT|nr:protein-tyrosine-phosphatase [Belnapia mucosa]MBL6456644.1 protein-tyrosine-phosphatase [Belnapia mucosa]